MSDFIKHECGIAFIRFRKPLQYYIDKYGTPLYGVNKLYLLMEKQHNRGQDGAGVANVKVNVKPGNKFLNRYRSVEQQPIKDIFAKISKKYRKAFKNNPDKKKDADFLNEYVDYTGEVWLGHLRYGTHSENTIEACHPMIRGNNWRSRNLMVAGNFNMTNVDELFDKLLEIGQHPREKKDTVTVLEKIGHFLDEENQRLFDYYKGDHSSKEISEIISDELDLGRVLRRSCKDFDGGYSMAGVIGNGMSFVARDPAGIRPAYYYIDDEVVVVASERAAINVAFEAPYADIKEIKPAEALIVKRDGSYSFENFIDPLAQKSCSFERIYFSRGTDPDIYQERKKLGKYLTPQVLEAVDFDLENTVFSYIPNTAETAFLGLMSGIEEYLIENRKNIIEEGKVQGDELKKVLSFRPRVEKLVVKDAKLRTFITDDDNRDDLVSHVYDTTYDVVKKGVDTLVVVDDSIVRGTTLERSILTLLDKIGPKRIVVVSSAPQIRFPDCYGIDMSRMKDFVAFRAAMALLKENGKEHIIDEVYEKCIAAMADPFMEQNFVKRIYKEFTAEEISNKIAEIIRPEKISAEVRVIYQTIENLHKACPNHIGDWYFTGNFPTQGGKRVVNKAFIYFMEGIKVRAY